MISQNVNKVQGYKACVGRNCKNEAEYKLQILFAKKPGWFCESCKKYFEDEDLLVPVLQSTEGLEMEHGIQNYYQ